MHAGLVFESPTEKETNVKSFSLKRRMTPVMVVMMHFREFGGGKKGIFGIRYSKVKHAVASG